MVEPELYVEEEILHGIIVYLGICVFVYLEIGMTRPPPALQADPSKGGVKKPGRKINLIMAFLLKEVRFLPEFSGLRSFEMTWWVLRSFEMTWRCFDIMN